MTGHVLLKVLSYGERLKSVKGRAFHCGDRAFRSTSPGQCLPEKRDRSPQQPPVNVGHCMKERTPHRPVKSQRF